MPRTYYTATLSRDLEVDFNFKAQTCDGRSDTSHTTKLKVKSGKRIFKTKKAALLWVEQMNKDAGEVVATFNGHF